MTVRISHSDTVHWERLTRDANSLRAKMCQGELKMFSTSWKMYSWFWTPVSLLFILILDVYELDENNRRFWNQSEVEHKQNTGTYKVSAHCHGTKKITKFVVQPGDSLPRSLMATTATNRPSHLLNALVANTRKDAGLTWNPGELV